MFKMSYMSSNVHKTNFLELLVLYNPLSFRETSLKDRVWPFRKAQ